MHVRRALPAQARLQHAASGLAHRAMRGCAAGLLGMVHLRVEAASEVVCLLGCRRGGGGEGGRRLRARLAAVLLLLQLLRHLSIVLLLQREEQEQAACCATKDITELKMLSAAALLLT